LEGGEGGSGDETTAKKRRRFQRTITKQIKSSVFLRKNRVTPSVAALGDTNLSDANEHLRTITMTTLVFVLLTFTEIISFFK